MTFKKNIGLDDQVYFFDKKTGEKFAKLSSVLKTRYTSPPFEIRNDWKNYFVIGIWHTSAIFRNSQPRGQVHKKSGSSIS